MPRPPPGKRFRSFGDLLAPLLLEMQGKELAQEASGRLGATLPKGGRDQKPGGSLGRRVRFQLPHTTIPVPSAQQEEQPFYRRLERLLAAAAAVKGSFEELFAAEGWEDLLEDKHLRKWLVRGGQGESSRPQPGQEVSVKLLGVLEDQSLVERDPKFSFVLGQGGAIQALECGVLSMQLGEVALFLARPACAYGCLGREPDIPQEAALLYEVTLLQVQDSPDPARLPASQRLRLGNQKREWGNFHFERGEYQQALGAYQWALHITSLLGADPLSPEEEEEETALREHQVKCLNNCAAAQLKLQQPGEALASCNEALRLDPDNVKALQRKGRLLSEQGEDQAALDVLKRALRLEPTTKAIHVELSKLARRQRGQPPAQPSPGEVLQEAAAVAHHSQTDGCCSSGNGSAMAQQQRSFLPCQQGTMQGASAKDLQETCEEVSSLPPFPKQFQHTHTLKVEKPALPWNSVGPCAPQGLHPEPCRAQSKPSIQAESGPPTPLTN